MTSVQASFSPGMKWLNLQALYSHISWDAVRNAWSITVTPPYAWRFGCPHDCSVEKSRSWEAHSYSASQETAHILGNLKVRHRIHSSPPLTLIQYALPHSILEILLIISIHQHLDLLKWSLFPVWIPNLSCVSLLHLTCYKCLALGLGVHNKSQADYLSVNFNSEDY
jgi:hypothetical protein